MTLLSAAWPASATDHRVGPPFTPTPPRSECEIELGLGACEDQLASTETGGMEMRASVVSPLGGLLPGFGRWLGETGIEAQDTLSQQSGSVTYELQLHITRAAVETSSVASAPSALVEVTVEAAHSSCRSCGGLLWEDLVSSSRERAIEDETLTLTVVLDNGGSPIPPGVVTIRAALTGYIQLTDAQLRPRSGETSIEVEATALSLVRRS